MPIDPTAQTEPLTKGQRIVADHERDTIAEPAELAQAIDDAIGYAIEQVTSKSAPKGFRWRCFHCQEAFNSHHLARQHFGATMDATPACQIKAHEGHLVEHIRKLEEQLHTYQVDDSDLMRSIRTLEADLFVAKRDAEQLGYDRGIRDAKKEAPFEARGALRWVLLHTPEDRAFVITAISQLLERDGPITDEQIKSWRDFLLSVGPGVGNMTTLRSPRCDSCMGPADTSMCSTCFADATKGLRPEDGSIKALQSRADGNADSCKQFADRIGEIIVALDHGLGQRAREIAVSARAMSWLLDSSEPDTSENWSARGVDR